MRHLEFWKRAFFSMFVILALASCAEIEKGVEFIKTEKGQQVLKGAGSALSGLLPIGAREERAIGGALASQVVARYGGLVRNRSLLRYVNLVGKAVAMTSDRPEIDYTFGVLNNNKVNAFAAPGGYVFVTKGLLRRVQSEAELACVLGHEIAHVTKKHILNVIRRSRAISGLAQVTLASLDKNPEAFDEMIKEGMKSLFRLRPRRRPAIPFDDPVAPPEGRGRRPGIHAPLRPGTVGRARRVPAQGGGPPRRLVHADGPLPPRKGAREDLEQGPPLKDADTRPSFKRAAPTMVLHGVTQIVPFRRARCPAYRTVENRCFQTQAGRASCPPSPHFVKCQFTLHQPLISRETP